MEEAVNEEKKKQEREQKARLRAEQKAKAAEQKKCESKKENRKRNIILVPGDRVQGHWKEGWGWTEAAKRCSEREGRYYCLCRTQSYLQSWSRYT